MSSFSLTAGSRTTSAPRRARGKRWLNRIDSRLRRLITVLDDNAFVRASYLGILGRTPDPEALEKAIEELSVGALRRRSFQRHLRESRESRDWISFLEAQKSSLFALAHLSSGDFVREAYWRLLGRIPDPQAANLAVTAIDHGDVAPPQILLMLLRSEEYRNLTDGLARYDRFLRSHSSTNQTLFIEAAFLEAAGRPPGSQEASGLQSRLSRNEISRERALFEILQSEESKTFLAVRKTYSSLLLRLPNREEQWVGERLLREDGVPLSEFEGRLRSGTEYWLRHSPTPNDPRSLATSSPEEIWIEPTTRCNIVPACVMCGYALAPDSVPRRDMDPAVWRRLLPLLRQARSIGLHGAGEPLLDPSLFDLLGELDPKRNETGFNSNGHLLTPRIRDQVIKSGLGWISISLDAATPGTYLRIRRRKDFEPLLGKIRALVDERNRLEQRRPEVEINMTLMKLNLEEAPPFVELAADLGVDRVMFQEIHPGGRQRITAPDGYVFDYEKEEFSGEREQHDKVMLRARQIARKKGVRFSYEISYGDGKPWMDETPAPMAESGTLPDSPWAGAACQEPWRRLTVTVTGDVFICCFQMANRVLLGNVMQEPVEEIWNGRRARLVREAMFSGEAPPACQGCYVMAPKRRPA